MAYEEKEKITSYGTHSKGRTNKTGYTVPKGYTTNRAFAETVLQFKDACAKAGIEPTKRQASKFRRRFGKAHNAAK